MGTDLLTFVFAFASPVHFARVRLKWKSFFRVAGVYEGKTKKDCSGKRGATAGSATPKK